MTAPTGHTPAAGPGRDESRQRLSATPGTDAVAGQQASGDAPIGLPIGWSYSGVPPYELRENHVDSVIASMQRDHPGDVWFFMVVAPDRRDIEPL